MVIKTSHTKHGLLLQLRFGLWLQILDSVRQQWKTCTVFHISEWSLNHLSNSHSSARFNLCFFSFFTIQTHVQFTRNSFLFFLSLCCIGLAFLLTFISYVFSQPAPSFFLHFILPPSLRVFFPLSRGYTNTFLTVTSSLPLYFLSYLVTLPNQPDPTPPWTLHKILPSTTYTIPYL